MSKAQVSENAEVPGSPSTGEPVYLTIGKLRRPHGVRGEMLMEVHTDFPDRIKPGTQVLLGESYRPITFNRVRGHKDGLLVGFQGFNTPEEVGIFRNVLVFVRADDRPELPEGEYYYHEILGMTVVDENGVTLGNLKEILETGANDVFVVAHADGRELLLPAIEDVILAIDPDARTIRVHLLPGLIDGVEDS